MTTRREILAGAVAAAVLGAGRATKAADETSPKGRGVERYRPPTRHGLGGVAIGNAFRPNTDEASHDAMQAAWDAGSRYYDTSPWYGLGLSERRFGQFLDGKKRDEFVVSTKIGRLLKADESFDKPLMWKDYPPFRYEYDYSAEGTRRSIEDSLQRMGLGSLDIVFIHDLSPDNGDLGPDWTRHFEVAMKGAAKELTRMREEGIIKAWGFGVNTIEPCVMALEQSDPDIFLSACQYSLIEHQAALDVLFPACEERGVSIVVGAPLNSGFLAGVDRYNYSENIPESFLAKRDKLREVAKRHGVDLRSAALQFCAAPKVVSAVIPGARDAQQASQNAASAKESIPADFWAELKSEKLIAADAPTPAAG